ncbi:putative cytochrome P450 49a1 [Operophtera brumata]|uniref:Putative cytochrome P450 49a1 n=1 Tax=Operophtera brumata TaxID=104452 RepID=A0A0L7LQH7_OPEBR|nr:putative cytochrome P450 49a1 [Operophtera brumata]
MLDANGPDIPSHDVGFQEIGSAKRSVSRLTSLESQCGHTQYEWYTIVEVPRRTSTSPQRRGSAAPALAAEVRPFSEIPGPIGLPMMGHSAHVLPRIARRTSTSPQRRGSAAPALAAEVRPFSEIPGPIGLPMMGHSAHVLPRIGKRSNQACGPDNVLVPFLGAGDSSRNTELPVVLQFNKNRQATIPPYKFRQLTI